mgnify:CR=1 FL=1
MELRKEQKFRFRIEPLEERIAPAHVDLPASPGHIHGDSDGPSAAPQKNPHFSGKFRELNAPSFRVEIDS